MGIEKNRLSCACGFALYYQCPVCQNDLDPDRFSPDDHGGVFSCTCGRRVPVKKIFHILENGLQVNYDIRCNYCHGPTVHLPGMNIANRCLYFPGCSGQADLFGGLQRETLTFFDFETTGLDASKHSIIEIGALKIDAEGDEHLFQTFVKPAMSISAEITRLNGISDIMVADAPDLPTALARFTSFLGDSRLVAHNADFDLPWLLVALLRTQREFAPRDVICTLNWARASQEPRCSLTALTKKYGIRHANAHRALADAAATKELYFIFENAKKAPRPSRSIMDFYAGAQKLVARSPESQLATIKE